MMRSYNLRNSRWEVIHKDLIKIKLNQVELEYNTAREYCYLSPLLLLFLGCENLIECV